MRNGRADAVRRIATLIGILGMAAVIVGVDSRQSRAQFGGGFGVPASQQINNPAVSPYLNLAQPGINPAVALQTLVQPQIQLGNAILGNQQQIGNLTRATSQLQTATPTQPQAQLPSSLTTGHPTAFLNTLGYFQYPTIRGQSLQGGAQGVQGGAQRSP